MDIIIDLKNYDGKEPAFHRTAARAIITEGDKYLLVYSKYGDYKFPGGGREEGETLEDTVVREVQEETGYCVKRESIKKYGKVHEIRKGMYDNLLIMDSHYYFCQVEEEAGNRNLDAYEAEYDYNVIWLALPEAIEMNRKIADTAISPWVIREIEVMERLIKEGGAGETEKLQKNTVEQD